MRSSLTQMRFGVNLTLAEVKVASATEWSRSNTAPFFRKHHSRRGKSAFCETNSVSAFFLFFLGEVENAQMLCFKQQRASKTGRFEKYLFTNKKGVLEGVFFLRGRFTVKNEMVSRGPGSRRGGLREGTENSCSVALAVFPYLSPPKCFRRFFF